LDGSTICPRCLKKGHILRRLLAMARLAGRLEATRDFFKGARVLMDVGARTVSAAELQQAAQVLAGHGMSLVSVISTNAETQEAGRQAGLGLVLPQPAHADNQVRTLPFVEGILLRRTLRSGQVARHEGHVAIIGDVNAGAEIIAGGDVIVWGKVRGIVHAGAGGDENAVVCALYLAPTQLRIGPYIARAPEGRAMRPRGPEKAYIRDGAIVVEPWQAQG
ncbi:MAG: septum site-determining protein MinC, partial [Anaerolineae bacterium]|nr:septum site-determining protein MinC [Anaerolineae bacterium]